MTDRMITIVQLIAGILIAGLTFGLLRVFTPLATEILGLWDTTTGMSIVANLSFILIIFFVLWYGVWKRLFEPIKDKLKGGQQ